jgi:hypothetical protein
MRKSTVSLHASPNFRKSLKKVSAETEMSMVEVTDLLSTELTPCRIKELKSKPEFEDEWKIVTCIHWAVGWVEHLAFKAIDEDGKPTKMFEFIQEWSDALDDYPIADESDYSELEYETAIENIESYTYKLEDAYSLKKGWAEKIFSWFWDNKPEAVENTDGDGAFPSFEDVLEAGNALYMF